MESVHNPDRFMADFRQVLSQGRKRIGILIGAGAPLSVRVDGNGKLSQTGDALIPGVEALTDRVLAPFTGSERQAVDAIRNALPDGGNIETVLSRIRLLQMALGNANVDGLNGEGYRALGTRICEGIGSIVGAKLPADRCAYHELVSWIAGAQRPHSVELFTTNYDLLLEYAFEKSKVPYFDGFSGGHAPFFDPVTVAGDDLPSRWTRLWKLHGSLGWKIDDGRVVRTGGHEHSELIYPDHLKYDLTQKQPYAALFERLKQFIMMPDTLLLTIGFSFRDAHICAVLDEALAVNANSSLFAFQFASLASEEPACRLAYDRPNVSVYASDGAVISGVPGAWKLGDPPKNWAEIRSSFWGKRGQAAETFLLGDFTAFCRFLALSYSSDLTNSNVPAVSETTVLADNT